MLQITFRTGKVLDNICVTYGRCNKVKHGGCGGHGHATLVLTPEEDIVGVALTAAQYDKNTTCVKDVLLLVANHQTGHRRAWSARHADKAGLSCTELTVPGKVLKCFTGRSGQVVDQLSCVWHTPLRS